MGRPSVREIAEEGSWRLFQLRQFLDATHGSTRVATSLLALSHLAQEVSVHSLTGMEVSPSKASFYGFIGYRLVRSARDHYNDLRIPGDPEDSQTPT